MTEKQFYIKCDDFNAWSVWEKGKDVIVFDLYKSDAQLVCDKLNELSDENEHLKQYKQAVSDVLLSYSQKNLSAKQLGLLTAIMQELGVLK